MANEDPKDRIKWEGDSLEEVRSWPEEPRIDIGGDLRRLQNREQPLDSEHMGKVLPGASELRDEHQGAWYRLIYWLNSGWIYVLHAFQKKSNQTSKRDIDLARDRMKRVKARRDEPFVKEEEKKSA